MNFTREQVKDIAAMAWKQGYVPIPITESENGELIHARFAKGQKYLPMGKSWTVEMPQIGVRMDDCVLLDYDGAKADRLGEAIPPLDHLAVMLGLDEMPQPIQEDSTGRSLHFWFALPEGIDRDRLKDSITGWIPYIDIKTGNQLTYLKPGKVIPDDEFPHRKELPEVPAVLLEALTKPERCESAEVVAWDGSPEEVAEARTILGAITPETYEQLTGSAKLTRDDWITVLMGIHNKFGGFNSTSLEIADEFSQRHAGYAGEADVAKQLSSFALGGGVTWAQVCNIAKSCGCDLSAAAKTRVAEKRESNVEPIRQDVAIDDGLDGLFGESIPSQLNVAEAPPAMLPGGDVGNSDFTYAALMGLNASGDFFSRSGLLAHVIGTDDDKKIDVIKPHTLQTASELAGVYCYKTMAVVDEKTGAKTFEVVRALMKDTHARLIDADRAQIVQLLRPISVVSSYPMLFVDDGQCRLANTGYNPEGGGVYVTGNAEGFRPMSKMEAVGVVNDALKDFIFVDPADKARAIAMLLTPTLVSSGATVKPVPVAVAEAEESQTGKTFWLKLMAFMHGELPAVFTVAEGRGVGSLDNSLSNAWLSGQRFAIMDNVRGPLNSTKLEAAVTSPDKVEVRIPHKAEAFISVRGTNISISSNSYAPTKDLANRICTFRLLKQPMDFEFSRYEEGNIDDHIKANVPKFLSAIYSIVAHWVRDGMQRGDESGHNMREWAGIVGWIVPEYFGLPHPMEGHQKIVEGNARPEIRFIRKFSQEIEKMDRLGEHIKASEVFDLLCHDADVGWPGGRVPHESQGATQVGKILGSVFGHANPNDMSPKSIVIEGRTVTRVLTPKYDDPSRTDKSYIVTIEPEEQAQKEVSHA